MTETNELAGGDWQDDPGLAVPDLSRRPGPRRGFAALAWVAILIMVAVQIIAPRLLREPEGGDGGVEQILAGLQGRYLVGAASFLGGERLFAESQQFNVGSVRQRERFVVLAAELAGPDAARDALADLTSLIELERAAGRTELAPEDAEVLAVLEKLYAEPLDDAVALSSDERRVLLDRLGWFGKLALTTVGDDEAARAPVIASARRAFVVVISVVGVGGLAGVLGFAGLVLMLVLALQGKLRGGLAPAGVHHGLYAETFAVWMLVFLGGQMAAGVIGQLLPGGELVLVLGMFFASLGAVGWPVVRGVPWRQVREEIGWTLGRRPALEPLVGVGCYAMGIPILALGILLTLGLMLVDAAIGGDHSALTPVQGPAHPIVIQLAEGKWWPILQVLVLGSVAAPIVEETMFRGVLYRHLRDVSAGLGFVVSVVLSTFLNTLIFAAVHPQGWIAIPALMSLAISFTLAREWRGTLVPSMIMHGLSNGLVLGMLTLLVTD